MANRKQDAVVRLPKSRQEQLFREVKNALLEHGKVQVKSLGIFETRQVPARRGRNPKDGSIVVIPAYMKIKFRPTKRLKESVCAVE